MVKFKPFDLLAEEFTRAARDFQNCVDDQERKRLLLAMRIIIAESDALARYYTAQYFDLPQG